MARCGILLFVLVLGACRPAPEEADPGPLALETGWHTDPRRIASVAGYAFRNPSNQPESLLGGDTVDLERLRELQTRGATLNSPRRHAFAAALFASRPEVSAAGCYIPHHLFLLENDRGDIIGAVEVCFSCRRIETVPAISKAIHPDWIALARVCESLGLGMGPTYGSAADFEADLHDVTRQ